jgi:hypothetical protein
LVRRLKLEDAAGLWMVKGRDAVASELSAGVAVRRPLWSMADG